MEPRMELASYLQGQNVAKKHCINALKYLA